MSQHLSPSGRKFVSDFAAFCRSKGDEEFDADAPNKCALAQFGYPGVTSAELGDVPPAVYGAVLTVGGLSYDELPITFSALADRLESLISDSPVGVVL